MDPGKRNGGLTSAARNAIPILLALTACQPETKLDERTVGAAANDLLKLKPYGKILIEVDHTVDTLPAQKALDYMAEELNRITGKETSQVDRNEEIPSQGKDVAWTVAKLEALEAEYRNKQTGGDTAALYIVTVDGHFAGDTDEAVRLAMAYTGTSIAVFSRTIHDITDAAASVEPDSEIAEKMWVATFAGTMMHEWGHLAGMVDISVPMVEDHKDPDSRGHGTNPDCIMNALASTVAVTDFIRDYLAGTERDELALFGEQCVTDIAAFQGN